MEIDTAMAEEFIGIIGGTGLGDALAQQLTDAKIQTVDTPFGKPSDDIMVGTFGNRKIAFLNRHGPGHKLAPGEVPFAANIFALKKLGVHAIIASGAVGSLRARIAPGNLVIVDQLIDKTFKRTNTFFADFGAVHCEMTEPVCNRLHDALIQTAKGLNTKTHSNGTYICMEGPQFSTRAESLMHRIWGGDLVGMTAMPEAKLAREAQICYALIALVSDYDCWQTHDPSKGKQALLKEILANLQVATDNCLELIQAVLTSPHQLVDETCHCRKSLEMAVWTNQNAIDPANGKTLNPLFE